MVGNGTGARKGDIQRRLLKQRCVRIVAMLETAERGFQYDGRKKMKQENRKQPTLR